MSGAAEGARVLAFPGQGIEPAAIVASLSRADRTPLLDALADRLGTDAWEALDLHDTRVSQPATYVASMHEIRHLDERDDDIVMGHSLGEISALVRSRALDEVVAFELVVRRAQVCHDAERRRPGRMISLIGCPEPTVEWIRRSAVASTGAVLDVAAWNNATQTVLSGDEAACAEAIRLAGDNEVIAAPLAIGGGFHSPLMRSASAELDDHLRDVVVDPPRQRVFSTSRGSYLTGPDEIRQCLARALVVPVRWKQSLAELAAAGFHDIVEVGPGLTLTKLSKRIPGVKVRSLSPVEHT